MADHVLPPVFVKVRDLLNPITDYDMCMVVADQIGFDNLFGCQKVRGLWKIYVLNQEARSKLLTELLTVSNQSVNVYGDNPFRGKLDSPNDEITKITIKDVSISVSNDDIKRFIEAKGVRVREILLAKVRNKVTKKLMPFHNGDRLLIVDKLVKALPRNEEIYGHPARIFHDGQVNPHNSMLCTKCFDTDHVRANCTKGDTWCKLCKCEGHKAGDEECEATTKEPDENIRTVFGHQDPLSNHHLADVKVLGQTFPSAEHAYKHTQAINAKRPDIAKEILESRYPHTVKRLSKNIPWNPAWEDKKVQIMERVLQSKMEQNAEFREALQESGDKVIVGAAPGDFFWGSGLSAEHTKLTIKEKWPGKNQLGQILQELRSRLENEQTVSQPKGYQLRNTKGSTQTNTS